MKSLSSYTVFKFLQGMIIVHINSYLSASTKNGNCIDSSPEILEAIISLNNGVTIHQTLQQEFSVPSRNCTYLNAR